MDHVTFRVALTAAMLMGASGVPDQSWANVTSTSALPSSTYPGTTMLVDYQNDRVFGVFPARPIASLTVLVRAYPDYGTDDAGCVFYGPGSGITGFRGETTFSFASLSKGELDRSQAAFNCSYYTHEPHGPLSSNDVDVVKVEAKDSEGQNVPLVICRLDSSQDEFQLPAAGDCRDACGDAICDGGEPKVSDALAVLKSALGNYSCPLRICDTNHDGAVTAADALKVLRRAVALRSVLLCTPSWYECEAIDGDDSWVVVGVPAGRCGNGVVEGAEQCDDGAGNSNTMPDHCRTDCTPPECGDGVHDTLEECEDGNRTGCDGCSSMCSAEFCGDDVVQACAGEECDDGVDNELAPDKCRPNCKGPRCGDGVIDFLEQCDDGNTDLDDGCGATCGVPECGDGVLSPSEECDESAVGSYAQGECCLDCTLSACGDLAREAD